VNNLLDINILLYSLLHALWEWLDVLWSYSDIIDEISSHWWLMPVICPTEMSPLMPNRGVCVLVCQQFLCWMFILLCVRDLLHLPKKVVM